MSKCKKCKKERKSRYHAEMSVVPRALNENMTWTEAYQRYTAPSLEKRQGSKGTAPNPYDHTVNQIQGDLAQIESNIAEIENTNIPQQERDYLLNIYEQDMFRMRADLESAEHKLDFWNGVSKATVLHL